MAYLILMFSKYRDEIQDMKKLSQDDIVEKIKYDKVSNILFPSIHNKRRARIRKRSKYSPKPFGHRGVGNLIA